MHRSFQHSNLQNHFEILKISIDSENIQHFQAASRLLVYNMASLCCHFISSRCILQLYLLFLYRSIAFDGGRL